MESYILLILFFIAFITTYLSIPIYIRKFTSRSLVVPDKYKKDILIPTLGGMAILGGILVSLVLAIFLVKNVENLLIFYFVIFIFATFGILDDLVNVGRTLKIFAPFFMALPIALLVSDTIVWIPFIGNIDFLYFFTFLIAPLFVMVVANLVNMHSGFNGLQSGLSLIVIFFIIIRVFMFKNFESALYIIPIFGALLAFYLFNRYPSKMFEGNAGSLSIGAAIGGYCVLQENMEFFLVFLFIPHIVNFLLFVYWRLTHVKAPKFGRLREDGTIEVPNPLTLKWIIPYYWKVTETQATYAMYGVTALFGIAGLYLIK